MKQIISKSGWLVMAAARRMRTAAMVSAALTMGMSLTMSMASCSSDDDVAQTTPPAAQGVSSIRVSVNAGVDGGTRSHMEYDSSTKERSLQFTSGDKLYVYGCINPSASWNDVRYIAGFLDEVTLDGGNTSATFSGTLYVYKDNPVQDQHTQQWLSHLEPSTYDFGDADPLTGTRATLYHAGSEESGNMSIDPDTKQVCFSSNAIGSNVGDLMTSLLEVTGDYDTSNQDFDLEPAANSIINCTIPGTSEASNFTVSYLVGSDADYFTEKTTSRTFNRSEGDDFTFAFFGDNTKKYHRIQITDDYYGTLIVDLGKKTLANGKVYNVTRGLNISSNTSTPLPNPGNAKLYEFYDDCDINLSGVSLDYNFMLRGLNNTINLNGLTATGKSDAACIYINKDNGSPTTTINVSGVNTFTDPHCYMNQIEWMTSIASNGEVKLAGNGTLTVTARNASTCGIIASNYTTGKDNTGEVDVTSQLAATGCTVTRSARKDNGNGTYSWTYTVSRPFAITTENTYSESYGTYTFNTSYVTASVSGTTANSRLIFNEEPVELTISNLLVEQNYPVGHFIESNYDQTDLTTFITISGDNYVTLSASQVEYGAYYANFIDCKRDLVFLGDGTLTITTSDPDNCGIIARNYTTKSAEAYTFPHGEELGYRWTCTVSRSARKDNGDGTYTWKYTVTPYSY